MREDKKLEEKEWRVVNNLAKELFPNMTLKQARGISEEIRACRGEPETERFVSYKEILCEVCEKMFTDGWKWVSQPEGNTTFVCDECDYTALIALTRANQIIEQLEDKVQAEICNNPLVSTTELCSIFNVDRTEMARILVRLESDGRIRWVTLEERRPNP